MARTTFCSVFLLWLVAALHSKKYLIEVADEEGQGSQGVTQGQEGQKDQKGQGVTQGPLPDLEEVTDESLEEVEEMNEDEEMKESEKGKDFRRNLRCSGRKCGDDMKCYVACCSPCKKKNTEKEKRKCLQKRECFKRF